MVCSYSTLRWESRPLIFKTWCTNCFLARFCSSPSASLTQCPLGRYYASFSGVQVPKTAEESALHTATGALSFVQNSSSCHIMLLRNISSTEKKTYNNHAFLTFQFYLACQGLCPWPELLQGGLMKCKRMAPKSPVHTYGKRKNQTHYVADTTV